jgi:predicted nucleic acid-binding protein
MLYLSEIALSAYGLLAMTWLGITMRIAGSGHSCWTMTVHFADRFKVTLYNAAYMELAHRCSLPLASLDEELGAGAFAVAARKRFS